MGIRTASSRQASVPHRILWQLLARDCLALPTERDSRVVVRHLTHTHLGKVVSVWAREEVEHLLTDFLVRRMVSRLCHDRSAADIVNDVARHAMLVPHAFEPASKAFKPSTGNAYTEALSTAETSLSHRDAYALRLPIQRSEWKSSFAQKQDQEN